MNNSSRQQLEKRFRNYRQPESFLAYTGLGDTGKTVLVPNRPGFIYVRFPKVIEGGELKEYSVHTALSKEEFRHNVAVVVQKSRINPSIYEVVDLWNMGVGTSIAAPTITSQVELHHNTHELYNPTGGQDPVMLDTAQLRNLQVKPTSPTSSKVIVDAGWYYWKDRNAHWFDGTTVELADYIPTGSYAYASLWFNPSTEEIHVEVNANDVYNSFSYKDLIEWPLEDYIPLAAIRLSAGNYQIGWSSGGVPNFVDMRKPGSFMVPGDQLPAGHPLDPSGGFHTGTLDDDNVTLTDTHDYYSSGTLDGALEELGSQISKVRVSSLDLYANYLIDKISAGSNITLTKINPGGDERLQISSAGGGASNFTDLLDVPSSYSGEAGKRVVVNSGETALEFETIEASRQLLSSDLAYYVRTDGSDSNNGLTNTSGGAFATIQHALDIVETLDLNGYVVTIQIIAGTYTNGVIIPRMTGLSDPNNLIIQGDSGATSDIVISTTGEDCFAATAPGAMAHLKYMKVQSTTSGWGVSTQNLSSFYTTSVNFGATGNGHVRASGGARVIQQPGNYTISGGGQRHLFSYGGQIESINVGTITLSGTPVFNEFARAQALGSITVFDNTYSGGATGDHFVSQLNSIINTNGSGATYLPGDAAGSTATGGQYV